MRVSPSTVTPVPVLLPSTPAEVRSGRGGLPRSLHRKLLSPDRRKRDPEELRLVAAEKQLRAERSRQQLEAERKAKLEKVSLCTAVHTPAGAAQMAASAAAPLCCCMFGARTLAIRLSG